VGNGLFSPEGKTTAMIRRLLTKKGPLIFAFCVVVFFAANYELNTLYKEYREKIRTAQKQFTPIPYSLGVRSIVIEGHEDDKKYSKLKLSFEPELEQVEYPAANGRMAFSFSRTDDTLTINVTDKNLESARDYFFAATEVVLRLPRHITHVKINSISPDVYFNQHIQQSALALSVCNAHIDIHDANITTLRLTDTIEPAPAEQCTSSFMLHNVININILDVTMRQGSFSLKETNGNKINKPRLQLGDKVDMNAGVGFFRRAGLNNNL
jgi:hypothetical protein